MIWTVLLILILTSMTVLLAVCWYIDSRERSKTSSHEFSLPTEAFLIHRIQSLIGSLPERIRWSTRGRWSDHCRILLYGPQLPPWKWELIERLLIKKLTEEAHGLISLEEEYFRREEGKSYAALRSV